MIGEHVCHPGCGVCLCVFRCPLCAAELVKRGNVARCLYRVECVNVSCGWFSSPLGDLVRMPELDLSDPTSKLADHCREFWAEVEGC